MNLKDFERIMTSTECDGCGELVALDKGFLQALKHQTEAETEAMGGFLQLVNGLSLNMGGGYGEFNDMLEGDPYIHLCHDCIVSFLKMFPKIGRRADIFPQNACHPFNGERCCDWGWTSKDWK